MDERLTNVVQFPVPKPDIKAATCGCGGQTFILVCDEHEVPEFVYCQNCQQRQTKITWQWSPVGDGHE